jgi:cytochrome c-type biogenesis protein CcmF
MAVLLLALAGICPLLAWRKASMKNLRRNFRMPMLAGAAALVVLLVLTRGTHLGATVVLALSVFVLATVVQEFQRGLRARRATRREGWNRSFGSLFAKNPRRYGGYLVHVGIVVLLAAVAVNVSYRQEVRVSNLRVGQPTEVGGYTITLADITTEETPAKFSIIGSFAVAGADGKAIGTIVSEKSMYPNQDQPVTEVGIRSSLTADLYIIIQAADPATRVASVAYVINPGVFWIWFGALVVLVGGSISAWPQRARTKTKEVPDEARLVSSEAPR